MLNPAPNSPEPTYSAPGINVNVRINGVPVPRVSPETRARCLVWRDGYVIEPSIAGLVIRCAHSGRVVASGFVGFESIIAAYEHGELKGGAL
ncbi:hypothetical protein [Methylobacterium soli]|uniref:Uncharacterized protein n=1 Tax=Methylobacterium soli TaxID=553447 RepID=A0A6L3SW11_9HYPH|nr:hypothetical protein [Methylobacterium soli]KAB1075924.1 hypothetical protein F6X53_24140 [Methylobacterium soli]GJE41863.1 hypothetical protein AEGHOMDF_1033 [Methylobacterium soli]